MTAAASRRSALRRYPALAFLVAAGLLALVLPSSLRLPLSGPPSAAELAPVPSKDASDAAGDLSSLALAGSQGVGVGGPAGPDERPTAQAAVPAQGRPRSKRCVGNPPRQTEDLHSPPCVAFFQGDNGGATARGVTRDEIVVVLYGDASSSSGGWVDYSAGEGGDTALPSSARAYARYFSDRYQFYGRQLHLLGFRPTASSTTAEVVRSTMPEVARRNPFAVVPVSSTAAGVISTEAARAGFLSVTHRGFNRAQYELLAPKLMSVAPDVEDSATIFATYTCSKLVGRAASHSGNPTDLRAVRRFAVLYNDAPEDPSIPQLARETRAALQRTCGVVADEHLVSGSGNSTYSAYPGALASMRADGVTTVVPVLKGGDTTIVLNTASSQGWHPEWLFPVQLGGAADDTTSSQVFPQDEWSHAFGVSFDYRRGTIREQSWWQAYTEACPDCTAPTVYDAPRLYDVMALLAYGIQAAGPRLTLESVDKGLHAVTERPSATPFAASTYFRPGNWSWFKDAKEMWWDPAGTAPGSNRLGCYRLPLDGRRFRAGEWTDGDATPFSAGPCQGPREGAA